MKRITCLASLVIALAWSMEARAGGPPPVYIVIDKVVFEPDEDVRRRWLCRGCRSATTDSSTRTSHLANGRCASRMNGSSAPPPGHAHVPAGPGRSRGVSRLAVRAECAAGTLVVQPVAGLRIERPLHLVRRKSRHDGAALQAFCSILREMTAAQSW
jgi:hypothetical protein